MLGQGSPESNLRSKSVSVVAISRLQKDCIGLAFAAALLLGIGGFATVSHGQTLKALNGNPPTGEISSALKPKSMRLRISWGGGVAQHWQGAMNVSSGSFSECRSLSLQPDSPGGIQIVDGSISIRQPSPSNYGGFDVTVAGDENTRLEIKLFPSDRPDQVFRQTVEFGKLMSESGGPIVEVIDKQQNQLTIQRAPGDQLWIDIAQPALVFRPGEMMSLGIRPNLTGITSRTANCRLNIVPARKTSPSIWSQSFEFTLDEDGSGRRERLELPMPGTEGVYDLIMELEPNWYQIPFNNRKQSVRRTIQLVVLEPQEQTDSNDIGWREFLAIDPATGRVLTRSTSASLIQLNRLLTAANHRPLGNDKFQPVRKWDEMFGQLEVGGWHAIPLAISKIGMPHIVEIEFPPGTPMAIGTSIIQPDATGQIPSIGFDSGVVIPDAIVQPEPDGAGAGAGMMKHRIVFWPNTDNPYLLIANRHEKLPALIGKIRILHGPQRLAGKEMESDSSANNRNFMAFYELPLFPENFGSSEVIDPSIQQPLDDWLTFYTGADRLIQFLKANSYRGAYVTVAIDGSSIYPSPLLDPTPKFDSGVFFYNAQDPKRKDVLEMLFRMFDRAGLKLVPTLAFTGPLPEIEAIRHRNESVAEFGLVNLRQQPRTESHVGLPIYNPLNVQVQQAVTRVIDELAARYSEHASFKGLAISCRPGSYTQLTGLQWGYDAITLSLYKSIVNSDATDDFFIEELLTNRKQEWIHWRAAQMRSWYLEMLDAVQRHDADGKLYLVPVDIYQNEEISSALSPSLHLSADFESAMLQLGFDRGLATADPDLVLLKPERIAPNQSLATQRVEIQTHLSNEAINFFRQGDYRGSLMFSRVSWAHFSELQEQAPIGDPSSPLIRLQQLSPAGVSNRRRFAESLKDNDSNVLIDGGILIANGQEEYLQEFMRVFCRLPDVRFQDVNPTGSDATKSPIAVRQVQLDDRWVFYAVNSSPWKTKCRIEMASLNSAEVYSLSDAEFVRRDDGPGVEFEIEPFGLVGGYSVETNSIKGYTFELPGNADQPLRSHLQSLQSKLVRANKAAPVELLANPKFEVDGVAALDGWDSGNQSLRNVRLENTLGHGDSTSLVLDSERPVVWIRSSPFKTPKTGRLSVSVWLRTDDPNNQPPLRLALEGRAANTDYYRFGSIGSLAPASSAKRVDEAWQRFAVHFDDLPTQGVNDLRIGFDLMGPGQVWIDDVEVYDRWFDSNDTKALTQLLATAGLLLSNSENIDQCRKIFNGYWPQFLDEYFPDLESPDAVEKPLVPEVETSLLPRTRPEFPRNRKSFR